MIVNAMGYSGTGSSAVEQLLSEFSNTVTPGLGKYEHVVFYTPHGLFDLEDRLLLNNTIHNADAAINDFYNAMKRLNKNDFGWFGGYKRHYGNEFMELVDEFLDGITEFSLKGFWSNDFEYKRDIAKLGKDTLRVLLGRKVLRFGWSLNMQGDGVVKYSFVDSEKFYQLAQKFVYGYCDMINPRKDKTLLVDQLILPHNLYRIPRYFKDDVKCIVLDRDPRDMFVLSKYVWPRMGSQQLFPTEPEEFVKFYTGLIDSEIFIDDSRIKRLHFENLVYKYEETVAEIIKFIGEGNLGEHINKNKKFNPKQSVKNTQNFKIDSAWNTEVEYIADKMNDRIYDFPYEIKPLITETTDP